MGELWLLVIKTAVRGNSTVVGMPYSHKYGLYLQLVLSIYTWIWQKTLRKKKSLFLSLKKLKRTP